MKGRTVNIQGHRGARGLFPENTVTAFIEAVKMGVDTLEMDVVISGDHQVVVSHEAWMNEAFCFKPDGRQVEKNSREEYNLFNMNYAEIRQFDCGKGGNPEFPLQKAIPEHKPLFSEIVLEVDAFTKRSGRKPVSFNIEIKSEINDNRFNPTPQVFIDLVYQEIIKHKLNSRVSVQSFDVRMLQAMKEKDNGIRTGLLVENVDAMDDNLERLGFVPDFYSPEFRLVNKKLVEEVHQKNMQLITWTVNEVEHMKNLLLLGVDGIISDYPNRVIDLVKSIN